MSKIKKIYLSLIIVSILISLFGVYQRYSVEKDYDRYEILIGLQDLKLAASIQDRPLIEVARDFLNAGTHTVVVDEATIENLRQSEEHKLGVTYSGLDINLHADKETLAFIENGLKKTLKDGRKIFYSDERTLTVEGRLVDLSSASTQNQPGLKSSDIEKMGLGFPESELSMLKKAGIRFLLRPTFQPELQDGKKAIDAYFYYISKFAPDQRLLFMSGKNILGGAQNIAYLREKMDEFQMIPVVIENGQQDGNFATNGLLPLIKSMDFQAIRLFSTWSFIQNRYDYGIAGHHEGQEIINTYYRAITERNIRLIYFRFFLNPRSEYVMDMDIYQKRFAELEHRLEKNYGITPVIRDGVYAPPNAMKQLVLSKKIKIFAIFGTIIACLFLLEELIGGHKRIRYASWLISFLVLLGSALLYREKLEQLFALLASIAFPTLSIVYLMRRLKSWSGSGELSADSSALQSGLTQKADADAEKADADADTDADTKRRSLYLLYLKGLLYLFLCMMISAVGAIFVMTLYAGSAYLLEFSKFVGVKASQMLPLIAVIVLYFAVIGIHFGPWRRKEERELAGRTTSAMDQSVMNQSVMDQIRTVLQQNVKVWQILLAGILFGSLAIMLLRSGHTSNVEPPSFELLLRNFLELITPARPRTKAIFLGFPALILLVILANRKQFKLSYPLFLLAATIGQANLVNSFSHIRTPILVSVYRVLGEFVISAFFVLIIVFLYDLGEKLYRRIRRHA